MDSEAPTRVNDKVTVEGFIAKAGACGLFQVLIAFGVYLCLVPIVWSVYFMAFGNYIPDWKCLDDVNGFGEVWGSVYNDTATQSGNKSEGLCEAIKTCHNIEFSKDVSTVATEWGLYCNFNWITSFILSMQMVGLLIGAYVGGQMADLFGRKFVLYGSVFMNGCLSLIAAFSVNWQMFLVLKFLLGVPSGATIGIVFLFVAEFIPTRWRAILATAPVWSICCMTFAAVTAILKDWKYIHFANAMLSTLLCLSSIWIPESMRWLAVKGKMKKAENVAHKIANTNKKPIPDISFLAFIFQSQNRISESVSIKSKHRFLDIFRPGLYKRTLITSFLWFTMAVIVFSIGFNIKALSGNFFLNLFLFACCSVVSYPLIPLVSEKLGRKVGIIMFYGISCGCSFCVVLLYFFASSNVQDIGLNVLSITVYVSLECAWSIVIVYTLELFPTVVRGFGYGCANGMARIGGIIAPYLIFQRFAMLCISYTIYGILLLVCCLLILLLPETKGRPLKDTSERKGAPHPESQQEDAVHHNEC